VDNGWFDETNSRGVIAALPKIRVLVDGAGDQTGNFGDFLGIGAEDEGEAGGEGGGGLHGWESELGNVVAVVEAKCPFDLVVSRSFAHFADVSIEGGGEAAVDKLGVGEDESFFRIEAYGYDI